MKRAATLLAVVGLTGAQPATAGQEDGGDEAELELAAHPALALDPRTLPRAEPGRWLDWDPRDPVEGFHRELLGGAMRDYAARDWTGALELLHELLAREPDHPAALHQAGITYFRLRRYGDCVELLSRFCEVAPHEVGATRALAHGLYSLGRYEEAREHYERVLAARPELAEALRGLALSHLRLGAPARALELLERVVELEPDHAEAHAWIAHVHFDEDRLDEARAACERSLELDPSRPRAWFLASGILAELGEEGPAEEARARFEELSRLQQEQLALEARLVAEPDEPALWAAVASTQVRRGDGSGARRSLARLVQLDPLTIATRILVLDAMLSLGDAKGARLAAFELEKLAGESVEAWQRLEVYWASVGDIPRQIQAGERHRRISSGR